jgi:hypothetical protein
MAQPYWVIEWGFTNATKACHSDETARRQLVHEMMRDFSQPI